MRFKNQVVIVTGASSGIGKSCAEAFAREGAKVALAARRMDRLKKLSESLQKEGCTAKAFQFDVREETESRKLVSDVEKAFGPCDVLINNAGISLIGPFEASTTAQMDEVLKTNLRGLMILTREVLPSMIKRKTGAIVNISSIAGKIGLAHLVIYGASKFAVSGFSQALLEEVRKHNIKVANICPGMVDTDVHGGLHDAKRPDMIRPEDVAEACLLAASSSQTFTVSEIFIRPRRPL